MHKILCKGALLLGALMSTFNLAAQQGRPPAGISAPTHFDVAVLANFERAQVARTGTPSFWFKGGSLNASVSLWRGLGIAGNFTGVYASGIAPNVNAGKLAYMFGPRYTTNLSRGPRRRSPSIFGEALFGGVHGFDSLFPRGTGVDSAANGFTSQVGGGVDVPVAGGFGIRALEMHWVHSDLPNNAANSQNDLKIGFGLSYRR